MHASTRNLDEPARNLQSIREKLADQPAKIACDTLPHPHVASVEPRWFESTIFKKMCVCVYIYIYISKVHPTSGNEGSEESRGVTVSFL